MIAVSQPMTYPVVVMISLFVALVVLLISLHFLFPERR